MKRRISIYIKDILENIKFAEKFIENIAYKDFASDKKTFYAVLRCIEIMGEAAKNVPEDIRGKYPEIPWKEIAGMRDKIIHFYFGINMKKVWMAVKEDIPLIKPHLKRVLKDLSKEEQKKKLKDKKGNAK
jgi:uncharacterized protein with HEPN domain